MKHKKHRWHRGNRTFCFRWMWVCFLETKQQKKKAASVTAAAFSAGKTRGNLTEGDKISLSGRVNGSGGGIYHQTYCFCCH